jgi:hypothetical protein
MESLTVKRRATLSAVFFEAKWPCMLVQECGLLERDGKGLDNAHFNFLTVAWISHVKI